MKMNPGITVMCRILKGNLAPGGAVAKITGKEGLGFSGKARTFDSEDDFVKAVESGSIKKGEKTVVILRYLGPRGGPGSYSRFTRATSSDPYSRDAGNAEAHESHHGCRAGDGRGMSDRWPLQRRVRFRP